MKSRAESAPRGGATRQPVASGSEVEGERETWDGSRHGKGWPGHAGNQAVTDFVRTRAGSSLPAVSRAILERQLGRRVGDVRIHTGPEAAHLTEHLDARAFTVGRHVVFGAGEYAPETERGLRLLAHELTHVDQQRGNVAECGRGLEVLPESHDSERESRRAEASLRITTRGKTPATGAERAPPSGRHEVAGPTVTVAGPAIQRQPRNRPLAELDVDNEFSQRTLIDYLDALDHRGTIEDHNDSDDKCRAIVKQWVEGTSPYVITARRAMLMIKEMQDGFTGDDDERAILELLWRSSNDDLREIFGPGGLDVDDLNSDFHTIEWDWLKRFYSERMPGALADPVRINPRDEAVALGTTLPVYAPRPSRGQSTPADQDPHGPEGDLMHPEWCATYEEWLSFFPALPTYVSQTGHSVLGPAAAPAATSTDLNAPPAQRRPPVKEPRERYLPTDRFIDGPTEEWVRANLPPNLVAVAYQLPTDCADIAVVLRHVWLAAHNREEMYNGWLCGSRRGEARTRDMNPLLLDEVYTGNVSGIVSPYADGAGNRLLTYRQLEPLLHPGDVMVWKHPGPGGHTHTIERVTRNAQGQITTLTGLQGNQPIDQALAADLRAQDIATQRALPRARRQTTPSEEDLRKAAGRRIERGMVRFAFAKQHPDDVWDWGEGTRLVAAGPPAAAPRPRPPRGQNRAISDWLPNLGQTTLENIDSTFESALIEVRTFIELGTAPTLAEVTALGQAAGDKLRELARDANDLQQGGTHYSRVTRMAAQIRWYGRHVNRNNQAALWNALDRAFVDAARGISSMDFTRTPEASVRTVDVLVTGFDPFNTAAARTRPPRPGDWNPSGAAARQLDGETLPVATNVRAAVEGVVLPVSFSQFKEGIVERVIDAHPNVNAVITVSLDDSLSPTGPVDLEQYAVGTHLLNRGGHEAVPTAPGGKRGRAIEQATAPLEQVAAETNQGGSAQDTVPQRSTVDYKLELEFVDASTADRAMTALGLAPTHSDTVTINDRGATQTIVRTMRREIGREGARITFMAGGHVFGAEILSGPAGNFLSNEVSYRALRRLRERSQHGGAEGVSFHVHTPGAATGGAEALPPEGTTPQERQQRREAETRARTVLTRLVRTLRRLIVVVARRIAGRSGGATP